jgi:integrase
LNPSELQKLVAVGEPGFYQTLFLTAALSGMRYDELLALPWSDIDLQAGKIFVRCSLSWARLKGETVPARPRFYESKTRSGIRTLPAPPELLSALRVWKLECPKGELDLVFAGADGLPAHRAMCSVTGSTGRSAAWRSWIDPGDLPEAVQTTKCLNLLGKMWRPLRDSNPRPQD